MRLEMLGVVLAGSVLFNGSMPGLQGALTRAHDAPPAWLAIPGDTVASSIEYTGDAGRERSHGTIVVHTGGDTADVVKAVAIGLAQNGFDLNQRVYERRTAGGTVAMISAIDARAGRTASIAIMAGLTGGELRITFADPSGS